MKVLGKYVIVWLFALCIQFNAKANLPEPKPMTEAQVQVHLQGFINDTCRGLSWIAWWYNIKGCDNCETVEGAAHCIEQIAAHMYPEDCKYLQSKLGTVCYGACNRLACQNAKIQDACAAICCPLNEDKITNCMSKGKTLLICSEPVKCGTALIKKTK